MATIAENIKMTRAALLDGVTLVAVSKYHPIESLKEAYDAGQRIFGESHVQEVCMKHDALPEDIDWHFIGHLQTNKVKNIIPFISMVHAVDSFKLLNEINKQASKYYRHIDCLLQLHIAQEDTKYGFSLDECRNMLKQGEWKTLQNVNIKGIMCMASNVNDETQIRKEFAQAYQFFEEAKSSFFSDNPDFCYRSWGMSHDFVIAMEEHSNLVRVGSRIFGDRL